MKRSITKALCLVCAGALALGAAGCSKSDSSSSASSEAASSVLGSAADYDYQNFTYSDGLDENGYWRASGHWIMSPCRRITLPSRSSVPT